MWVRVFLLMVELEIQSIFWLPRMFASNVGFSLRTLITKAFGNAKFYTNSDFGTSMISTYWPAISNLHDIKN